MKTNSTARPVWNLPLSRNLHARLGCASVCALAVLSMTGCKTPTALKPADIAKVNQTHVRAYLPQKEFKATFGRFLDSAGTASGPGAGGALIVGGILDVLMESARTSNANVRVEQLRRVTRDLDFRSTYSQAISNAIPTNSWLKLGKFESLPVAPSKPTKEERTNDAILNINTDCLLSPDCSVLFISARLDFYLPGNSARPAAANLMAYYSAAIGGKGRAEAIRLWTTNNGAAFRKNVSEGVEANAKLIQYVLQDMGGITNAAARTAGIRARFLPYREGSSQFFPLAKAQMTVKLFEETPDRLIFQAGRGPFFSFPRKGVELESVVEE